MDFAFSEEEQMLRDLARRFADKELRPHAADVDRKGEVSRQVIDKAAQLGFLGVFVPEEYGGGGFGEIGSCIVMEEISRACFSTSVVIGGHTSIGAMAIFKGGSEEQKRKWLPPMCEGKILGAFALTEPGAGSDAGAIATRAVAQGDQYVLNGQKIYITNGGMADVYSVFAKTNPDAGVRGISAFIVPADMPGVRAGKPEEKMGIRGSHTSDLFFEDVRVPKENLLGEEGHGFVVAMKTLDVGRITVAAQCLGQMKEALDLAVKYSKERVQFGKPIAKQQAIQWMLAEMAADVYAAESMTYRAAWMCDQGMPITRQSAMTKLFASEALGRCVDHAVQIHGGMGYMSEFPVERMYRDARITRIFEGTNEIQRLVIANDVLKRGVI
jgi:acyl-CoA dehydrogenase